MGLEAFWESVEKTDSCWLWRGHINIYGYGRYNGKGFPSGYVHRSVFFWTNGYLPEPPRVVGHTCDVRNCVRPEHLVDQTQQENVRQYTDRIKVCKQGHEYTPENTYIKKDGARKCRECNRLQQQVRNRKR